MPVASEYQAFLKKDARPGEWGRTGIGKKRTISKSVGFCCLITKILEVLNPPIHTVYLLETRPYFSKSISKSYYF